MPRRARVFDVDDVRIVTVDALADDGVLEAWREVEVASVREQFGDRHTVMSVEEMRGRAREETDHAVTRFGAVHGMEMVGQGWVAMPLRDNPRFAAGELNVLPKRRRQGVGAAVLRAVEAEARRHGRTTVCIESEAAVDRPDPAQAFAARHGYALAQANLRQELELDDGLGRRLDAAEAEAVQHAAGYDLLTWWDQIPERWLDQRAVLATRMSTDAPMGDLDVEEEVWDADRVAEQLRVTRAQGRHLVETVVVDRNSGTLAAFTDLIVSPATPEMAYQWDTLVLREHRGRRLGQLVKAANLRALLERRPQVRSVVTWNADVNEPMLRVNRAIGFTVTGQGTEWQKHLDH